MKTKPKTRFQRAVAALPEEELHRALFIELLTDKEFLSNHSNKQVSCGKAPEFFKKEWNK